MIVTFEGTQGSGMMLTELKPTWLTGETGIRFMADINLWNFGRYLDLDEYLLRIGEF